MSDKEEFEKWFQGEQGKPYDGMYMFALAAWQARQPEIDALSGQLDSALLMHDVMRKEIAGLKETVADLVAKLENLPDTSEFTLWWQRFLFEHGAWKFTSEQAARAAFNAKNPEIAALNMTSDTLGLRNRQLMDENAALKAENERLLKDAERLAWMEAHPRLGQIHVDGEVKDCYLYAISGALGVPLRAIIDAAMKETK